MPNATWSDACFAAIGKPLPLLLDDLYISSGVLVSCLRARCALPGFADAVLCRSLSSA
jgi:hypothetical protein